MRKSKRGRVSQEGYNDRDWVTIEEMREILYADIHDFYSKFKKGK